MALTEAERSVLYESMRRVHGPDITESIMTSYPPSTGDDLATKRGLTEFQTATRADLADPRTDMATLKTDLIRTLGTWLFASQAGVTASVVLGAVLG